MINLLKILFSLVFPVLIISLIFIIYYLKEEEEPDLIVIMNRYDDKLWGIREKHKLWLTTKGKKGKKADFENNDLSGFALGGLNMRGVNFKNAIIRKVNDSITTPYPQEISDVDFSHSNFNNAQMNCLLFIRIKLDSANLDGADLSNSNLRKTTIEGASFHHTNLRNVIFEPMRFNLVKDIGFARNIDKLKFEEDPSALYKLREELKKSGFREQEKKVTYAIKKQENVNLYKNWINFGSKESLVEYLFNLILFEFTCNYGMSPGRLLILFLLTWYLCTFIYDMLIMFPGKSAIYVLYKSNFGDEKSIMKVIPIRKPRFNFRFIFNDLWRVHRASMFFGLMSAFNIGFRDINFGRWLRSLTKREYDLKAKGWIRTVSGIQALISVYLFALWLLTYFGQPFN